MGQSCSTVVVCTRRPPSRKKERKKDRKGDKKVKKVTSKSPSAEPVSHDEAVENMAEWRLQNTNERAERQTTKMAEIKYRRTPRLEAQRVNHDDESSDLSLKITSTPAPRPQREKFRPKPSPRRDVNNVGEDNARRVTPPEAEQPSKLRLIHGEKGDIPYPAYRFLRKEKNANAPDIAMPKQASTVGEGARSRIVGENDDTFGATKMFPRQIAERDDDFLKSSSARIASPLVGALPNDLSPRNKAISANDPLPELQPSIEDLDDKYSIGCRFTYTNVCVSNVQNVYETRVIATRQSKRGPMDPVARAAQMDAYISGTNANGYDPFSQWRSGTHGYIEDGRVLSYNAGTMSRTLPVPVDRQTIKNFDKDVDHLIAVQTAEGVLNRNPNRTLRNARGVGPISRQSELNRPVQSTLYESPTRLRSLRPNLTVPGLPTPMTECLDRFAERYTRRGTSPDYRF